MTKSNLIRSAIAVAMLATSAEAVTPTAVATCNPCSNITDMTNAARNWAHYNALNNTVILMHSLNQPLSAFSRVSVAITRYGRVVGVSQITTTTDQAFFIDANIFARSIKIPPIKAPTHNYNESDDELEAFIYAQFTYENNTATDTLHGLQTGLYTWYLMKDTQTTEIVQIWVGEVITVNYANGYSEKWQFLGVPAIGCRVGPGVPCEWRRVPGTLMHNGKPVNTPSTTPAAPVPNAGSTSGQYIPWPNSFINSNLDPHFCFGTSEIVVTAPDGSQAVGAGNFVPPC